MAEGILYDNSLIDAFEKSLRSAFNRPVRLTRKGRKTTGAFRSELVDGDEFAETNGGSDLIVVREIRTTENEPSGFYFAFVATFEWGTFNKYALQHSSLQVFHDLGRLVPLFRAEWSQEGTLDKKSTHAQPHWHFAQSPERIADIVRSKFSPPNLSNEFIPEPERLFARFADSGDFHFAMSSLWAKDKPCAHKEDFESDNFPIWFDNLTKYVAAQIAYIAGKAPSMRAKIFAPEEPNA